MATEFNETWTLIFRCVVLACFGIVSCGTGLWFLFARGKPNDDNRLAKQRLTMMAPTQDAAESRFVQKGYVDVWVGWLLYHGWLLTALLLQASIWMCIISYNIEPDADLNAVFTMFYYPSAVFLLVLSVLPPTRHLFLQSCALDLATHVLIEEDDDEESATDYRFGIRLGKAKKMTLVEVESEGNEKYFLYMCVRYLWIEEDARFRPTGVCKLTCDGISSAGLDSASASKLLAQGKNMIDVPVPPLWVGILQEFIGCIYIFQLHSAYLAYYWKTWNLASIILLSTVGSGVRQALLVRRQQLKIKEMVMCSEQIDVLRDGAWISIPCTDLVIQDVVSPKPGTLQFDGVVVGGGGLTNEAMLTGEPMPVLKSPVDRSPAILSNEKHKKNMLFAGTELLQANDLICVVTATGALTAKGQLIRMILFPSPVRFKFSVELPFAYLTIALYGIGCMLTMSGGGGLSYLSIFGGTYCMLQAINPMLPVSLASGQAVAVQRLSAAGVNCLSPPRTTIAGKLHMVVFDKTGTLTETGMSLVGLQPGGEGKMMSECGLHGLPEAEKSKKVMKVDVLWSLCLASCHSVAKFGDSFVGPQVEVRMLEASGWTLQPSKTGARRFVGFDYEAEVLRTLDFDHNRMNSGVLVRLTKGGESKVVFFLKGGYERIGGMCKPPDDYERVTVEAASKGYYVLGVVYRYVQESEVDFFKESPRADLEKDLLFLGLLNFRNELKPDSASAIAKLTEGFIWSVICSGDNAYTAAAIARECGILRPQKGSLLVGELDDSKAVVWRTEDGGTMLPTDPQFTEFELAVTGKAYETLTHSGEIEALLSRIRVFGRMLPDQKLTVVQQYQNLNLVVGMCGDGGNDCAALRGAHVGVALSDAEASIVAPFSSGKNKSCHAVVEVAKVGRATITTNFASYKFFLLSGICVTFWKVAAWTGHGEWPGEYHFLTIDVIYPIFFTWGMMGSCHAAEELAPAHPPSSLFGSLTAFGIAVPILSYVIAFLIMAAITTKQSWYLKPSEELWNYELEGDLLSVYKTPDQYVSATSYTIMTSFIAFMALVVSLGGKFRRPVYQNWRILVVSFGILAFQLILLFTGPHALGCIFRVNCDNEVARYNTVPVFTQFSAWGTDGCFYGPQADYWFHPTRYPERFPGDTEEEREAAAQKAKPYKISAIVEDAPSAEGLTDDEYKARYGCRADEYKTHYKCIPPPDSGLPYENPNNLLPSGYRITILVFIIVLNLVNLAFASFGLAPLSRILSALIGVRSKEYPPFPDAKKCGRQDSQWMDIEMREQTTGV